MLGFRGLVVGERSQRYCVGMVTDEKFPCVFHSRNGRSQHMEVSGGPVPCIREGVIVLGVQGSGIAAGGPGPMLLPGL